MCRAVFRTGVTISYQVAYEFPFPLIKFCYWLGSVPVDVQAVHPTQNQSWNILIAVLYPHYFRFILFMMSQKYRPNISFKDMACWPLMVVDTFSLALGKQREVNLCEIQTILDSTGSSRLAGAIEGLCLKTDKQIMKNPQMPCFPV